MTTKIHLFDIEFASRVLFGFSQTYGIGFKMVWTKKLLHAKYSQLRIFHHNFNEEYNINIRRLSNSS